MRIFLFMLLLQTVCLNLISVAHGFVPRAQFILKQTSELMGKGPYQIEKSVTFKDGTGSFQLRETWTVDDENSLKVSVRSGNQTIYQALFLNGKKFESTKHPNGTPIHADFFERTFIYRQPRKWLEELVQDKVLATDSLALGGPRDLKDLHDYRFTSDANVRLSRTNGTVAFLLSPPAKEGSSPSAQLWIDQNSYQVLKIRTLNGSEIRAEKYISAVKGLNYPGQISIDWNGKQTEIQTKAIESIKSVGKNFDPNTLATSKWEALLSTPLKTQIEEFYERFR